MSTLAVTLAQATARLATAGVDNPPLDARLLLEAASGLTRAELLLRGGEPIELADLMVFDSLLVRRCAREPVARILGWREFWGLPFRLSAATLEPRPDSETVIEAVLDQVADRSLPLRLLDLGTGTGCLLAALLHELPCSTGLGVDASEQAVATARENLAALSLDDRGLIRAGDWWQGIDERFDVIVSNPPYLREDELVVVQPEVRMFDPPLALAAGSDGLAAYRDILSGMAGHLAPAGVAVLELGIGQAQAVAALATQAGLAVRAIRPDLAGIPRALVMVNA